MCQLTLERDKWKPLKRTLGGPQSLHERSGGALFRNGNENAVHVLTGTYLGGEGVAVDAVFRAPVVLNAIVHVYFLELVLVRQWTTRDVNVVPRGIVHSEHDTVSSVADTAAHLQQKKKITHYVLRCEDGGNMINPSTRLYTPTELQKNRALRFSFSRWRKNIPPKI